MRVTAVVPVYNEEMTISNVLKVLLASKNIDKVIIVDDGSRDATPKILKKFKSRKLKKIKLKKNSGKGNAVKIATKNIKSGVILFIDGDLIGLKEEHVERLLNPVVNGDACMVVGLRDKGSFIADLLMPYFPLTGGERAMLADAFTKIRKNPLIQGWGLESVMNDYFKKKKLKVVKVKLDGMNHIGLQTKKFGLMSFIKEIYYVASTKVKLLRVRYG